MGKKYIASVTESKQHQVNLEALVTLVQELKWNYFEKYHREPKYIKMPVWLVVLLRHHYMQIIGYSDDKIATYMGFIICETFSIEDINQIEVF